MGMTSSPSRPNDKVFDRTDAVLYGLVVLAWGTSWIAIPAQLGVVAPEVSVFYRFLAAGLIMMVWMLWSGRPMSFPPMAHARFALLGILTFSSNFAIFYYAGFWFASGLLAVVFSTATIFILILGRLIYGDALSGKVLWGAAIGLAGICLVFWPKIASTAFDQNALLGFAAALAGTLLFSFGSMLSRSNQAMGLPVLQGNTWSMLYGSLWLLVPIFILGRSFLWDPRPAYALALSFHVVFSTILAFGAYMTLLGRIGPARAGYATIAFPIFALIISTVFEDYAWTPPAILGVALVVAGNIIVLSKART